jgi:Tfp pilus assembly protein FimT
MLRKRSKPEAGFSMIELMISLVVLLFGVLAVLVLIINGVQLQSHAREISTANNLAKDKLEELHVIQVVNPQRACGGNLNANDPDKWDAPQAGFRRRWIIGNGPAGTHNVTISAFVPGSRVPPVQVQALLECPGPAGCALCP